MVGVDINLKVPICWCNIRATTIVYMGVVVQGCSGAGV